MDTYGIVTAMNLQIGVKVIIKNSQNQVLLLRRASQYLLSGDVTESWDIPGGRIEPDENLEQALIREVQEEMGVMLEGSPALLMAQDIFVEAKGLHVVRLTYTHTTDAIGAITLSDEHTDSRWVTLEESKSLTIEPYLRAALDSIV